MNGGGICGCCDKHVDHLHLMEWDGPLSWLCSECMQGAVEEENERDALPPAPADRSEGGRNV